MSPLKGTLPSPGRFPLKQKAIERAFTCLDAVSFVARSCKQKTSATDGRTAGHEKSICLKLPTSGRRRDGVTLVAGMSR